MSKGAAGAMQQDMFRKEALERLSSPERLDRLMRVTNAKGWVALAVAVVALAGLVLWGIFGSIPTKISGHGILMPPSGVQNVIAHRLSTIMKADRIYVLVAGRVVQQGTYDELVAVEGPFADLVRRQIA